MQRNMVAISAKTNQQEGNRSEDVVHVYICLACLRVLACALHVYEYVFVCPSAFECAACAFKSISGHLVIFVVALPPNSTRILTCLSGPGVAGVELPHQSPGVHPGETHLKRVFRLYIHIA